MRNISNPLMTFWKWTYRVIEIIQSLRNSPAICPISKNSKRQSYFGIKIQEHLNPDTISRLYKKVVPLSILYGWKLWCDLQQRDLQAPSTLQHFICKTVMDLHRLQDPTFVNLSSNFFPYHPKKKNCSTSIGYVILILKPLPYRYFYIGCFPTYSPPKANNFALFTTSLLSC